MNYRSVIVDLIAYTVKAGSRAESIDNQLVLLGWNHHDWTHCTSHNQNAGSVHWFLSGIKELHARTVHYSTDQLLVIIMNFDQHMADRGVWTTKRKCYSFRINEILKGHVWECIMATLMRWWWDLVLDDNYLSTNCPSTNDVGSIAPFYVLSNVPTITRMHWLIRRAQVDQKMMNIFLITFHDNWWCLYR